MPLAGAFNASAEHALAMPKLPLTWLLCHDCGLVNVEPDVPDEVIYRTYSYAASTVPGLVRHHRDFAAALRQRYGDGPLRLLEIGGNDGVLLNQLPERWLRTNVDPSDVARRAWVDSAWGLFQSIDEVTMFDGELDVVTSSNAFAHFSDIAGALEAVARLLKPGGEFWIEVHDLHSTLDSGQWDTIYHEHKVEWSTCSLINNVERVGLRYEADWYLPLHGGLLRFLFRKHEAAKATCSQHMDFASLQRAYDERKRPPLLAHSAAYGAAARATVYLNQMPGLPIDYVVDSSPLRAGKFVPGLGIPVLPPEVFEHDKPETTLITAWNHAADIRARHPDYEGWVTAW